MSDFKHLTGCSNFNHLMLFKQAPLSIGSQLLHIPTTNYKYDLYFHIHDEDTIEVSLWRYFSGSWSSEEQDSFLISSDSYVNNIDFVDNELSKAKAHLNVNCIWLEQSAVQDIFKHYKSFALSNAQMGFEFQ